MTFNAFSSQATSGGLVVIACGALAKEILEIQRVNNLSFELTCIPAAIHNTPQEIPQAVEKKILEAKENNKEVFVAFADCGTGGQLDTVLNKHAVQRLPGAHCYEFYSTSLVFSEMMEQEIGTFFLTDFLARHFEVLVIKGLGMDKHPELMSMYFGNYKRLVYLSQSHDDDLMLRAKQAAQKLGLEFIHRYTGFGDLEHHLNIYKAFSEPVEVKNDSLASTSSANVVASTSSASVKLTANSIKDVLNG
jgi:hypothetical protein